MTSVKSSSTLLWGAVAFRSPARPVFTSWGKEGGAACLPFYLLPTGLTKQVESSIKSG